MERFKRVEKYPNYNISDTGKLYNTKTKRFCKGREDKGYIRSHIYQDGKAHAPYIQELVMEAFVSPRPEGLQINHIDCNPKNNRVNNLEYVTPKGNSRHAMLLGRKAKKLKASHVRLIKTLLRMGASQYKIAKTIGINQSCVSDIKTGVAWSHITNESKSRANV